MPRALVGGKDRAYIKNAFVSLFIVVSVLICFSCSVFAEEVTEGTGKALGGDMFNAVVLLSHSFGSSIEPISILFVEALVSLGGKAFPDTFGQYTQSLGFMNSTSVSILVIILFVLLKMPKSWMPTRVFGIAIGDIENHVMAAFNFVLPFIIISKFTLRNSDALLQSIIRSINISKYSITGEISVSILSSRIIEVLSSLKRIRDSSTA